MECKKCGKKISDTFEYCDECRNLLKEEELNKLIEENKELNKLEITKELETLDNIEEKSENEVYLKDEFKDLINFEEDEKEEKKNIIIMVSIIVIVLLIIALIITVIFKKPKAVEEEKTNYNQIITKYGDSINLIVSNYLKENTEIPSWSYVNEVMDYKEHKVSCITKKIYKDGNIYLNDCKVDGIKTDVSYGKVQDEKEGKSINIYKEVNNTYTNLENENLIGAITCSTEECEFIAAYERFVLIKENDKYYLYNYENNSIEFGPFKMEVNSYEKDLLVYENKLYGILYDNGKEKSIYNVNTEKTIKNIEGNLLEQVATLNPNLMYKYGYVVLTNENKNNFLNLKSGNISYVIDGKINYFIENYNKDLVYITTHNTSNNKITIYNSNGKKLFNGNEYNGILVQDKNIIIYNDTNYYIYDNDLKKTLESKTYDSVLNIYDNYVVVIDTKKLELLDLNDNILATFDLEWEDNYMFNSIFINENIINLIIDTQDKSFNYYYNIDTKEYGVK